MKKEEMESLGFDKAYLDEPFNEGGERRVQLEHEDFETIKVLLECGGREAVDACLNATWNAWICAESLVRAVDSLFNVTNHGRYNKQYDELVEKLTGAVIDSMKLALVNAETEILYKDDPTDEARAYIESFAYGLSKRLEDV